MKNYSKAFVEAFEPIENLEIKKHTIFFGSLVAISLISTIIYFVLWGGLWPN